MKYDDLLNLPYEDLGRFGQTKGIDCYGVVLELCKRNGTPLKDIVYPDSHVPNDKFGDYYRNINAKQIPFEQVQKGDVLQCTYNGNLHLAFILSKETAIHATKKGVRISPLIAFSDKKYFRVTK